MGDILPALRAVVYETVLGTVLVVGSLALALEALPALPLLPEFLQIAGLLLALGGGALWVWATAALVLLGRGTPLPLDPPRQLVVAGPYRYVRNPMHLGLAAFLFGEALLFRSISLLVFAAAAGALLVLWVVPREERALEERFGERYVHYRDLVRSWSPRREAVRRAVDGLVRRLARRRTASEGGTRAMGEVPRLPRG